MSADSVPSSKTNIFQNKLIYCRHFRTYSRCAMFDWSDTVFRRRNVTRRPYYSRGIEGEKPRFADCLRPVSGVPNIDCVSGLLFQIWKYHHRQYTTTDLTLVTHHSTLLLVMSGEHGSNCGLLTMVYTIVCKIMKYIITVVAKMKMSKRKGTQ